MNHPNIITIYEINETASTPFIAAEFIAGENLRERVLRTRLTISESLDIWVLKDYLRGRKALLVVDNFEQVSAAAPVITELLAAAPRLNWKCL